MLCNYKSTFTHISKTWVLYDPMHMILTCFNFLTSKKGGSEIKSRTLSICLRKLDFLIDSMMKFSRCFSQKWHSGDYNLDKYYFSKGLKLAWLLLANCIYCRTRRILQTRILQLHTIQVTSLDLRLTTGGTMLNILGSAHGRSAMSWWFRRATWNTYGTCKRDSRPI